jgi:hypothetical protein
MEDQKLLSTIVHRDSLGDHYASERQEILDLHISLHVKNIINSITYAYKQNYIKHAIPKDCYQHELYQCMLEELRNKDYEVIIKLDECNTKETDIIGELTIRWNSGEPVLAQSLSEKIKHNTKQFLIDNRSTLLMLYGIIVFYAIIKR